MFEVRATVGGTYLGGQDSRIANYFTDRFQEKLRCDLRESPCAIRTKQPAFSGSNPTMITELF